ncbi:hypothetical protein, partial [Bizionia paragorgiae]
DFVREDFPQENQKLAKEQRPNDRTKISNVFYTVLGFSAFYPLGILFRLLFYRLCFYSANLLKFRNIFNSDGE